MSVSKCGIHWQLPLMLVALLLPVILASPPTTTTEIDNALLTATACGQESGLMIGINDTIKLNTRYLLSDEGILPANCTVSWRIEVQADGFKNYGFQVTGAVELEDPENDATSCGSSEVLITDRDEAGDVTAVTESICGNKRVSYVTYQDTVTIHLRVSETGAGGKGFSVTISPVFACGGVIEGSIGSQAVIKTPRFPKPYPLDLLCVWDVEAPADSSVKLQCKKFSLPRRRRKSCSDYLMVQRVGQIEKFCGAELRGRWRAQTIDSNQFMLMFRSSGRFNQSPGFVCKVNFVEKSESERAAIQGME